ncbi:MAG: RNA-binding S4 domain-containing protein [Lachnospiraceae bacterium]|nr:RNA-binding S4 domain-containing protein [Lachnospiraceae bacterium]
MKEVMIKDEFIKLGHAIKLAGLVDSGVEAKEVIQDGKVKVNGEVEVQRGKKLYNDFIVEYNGESFKVISK